MSRRRPSNLSDRFDSTNLGTYDQKPILEGFSFESPTLAHTKNIDVFRSMEIMAVLLKDYQSKHINIDAADPNHLLFPFAWIAIQVGDEIKNLSTNVTYTVAEIINTRSHKLKNYVRIEGAEPPKSWHILRLDDKNNKVVNIIPAYPDSEIKPYEFNADGHIQDDPSTVPWIDSITYSVVKETPGSRDRHMFGGNQELTPRFREEVDNHDITNQMIDTEIRFDFWTASNESSERMRGWFRGFAIKYRWLLRHNGLAQFFWALSYTAPNATRWRPGIVHRSSSYFFRTEYSISENLFTIRDFDTKVFLPSDPGNPNSEQININI